MANPNTNTMSGALKTQVAKTAPATPVATMKAYVDRMESAIAKALPSVMTPDRFVRIVHSALSSTPELGGCTQSSFLASMMTAAQLGLEPNTPLGQAYIIPYRNKGQLEAQFQIGYKGLMDLAYRSGDVASIQAHVVYANDDFTVEYGLEPKLSHKPATHDRGEATHVYAVIHTKSGGYVFEVMSLEDVRRHAKKYSKAYSGSFSPWSANFEEMAKKTVLKRVLKYAPLKADIQRAVTQDYSIKHELSADMSCVEDDYVDVSETNVDSATGEVVEHE